VRESSSRCKIKISGCAKYMKTMITKRKCQNPGCAGAHPQTQLAPPLAAKTNQI